MKPEFQTRAQESVERSESRARRPIVAEFAGVPRAGKASTVGQIYAFLKRCGFRVQVVVERGSVCPVGDKTHITFNGWTARTAVAQVPGHAQDPPQVLILDRGLFGSVAWLISLTDRLPWIRQNERETTEKFVAADGWRKRVTGVIVMTVAPTDAMAREAGYVPAEAESSIANAEVLQRMLRDTRHRVARMKVRFGACASAWRRTSCGCSPLWPLRTGTSCATASGGEPHG